MKIFENPDLLKRLDNGSKVLLQEDVDKILEARLRDELESKEGLSEKFDELYEDDMAFKRTVKQYTLEMAISAEPLPVGNIGHYFRTTSLLESNFDEFVEQYIEDKENVNSGNSWKVGNEIHRVEVRLNRAKPKKGTKKQAIRSMRALHTLNRLRLFSFSALKNDNARIRIHGYTEEEIKNMHQYTLDASNKYILAEGKPKDSKEYKEYLEAQEKSTAYSRELMELHELKTQQEQEKKLELWHKENAIINQITQSLKQQDWVNYTKKMEELASWRKENNWTH